MTPPVNPYRTAGTGHYDLGPVRIVDHNANGKYDAGLDSLETLRPKGLKKLGLKLEEGADLAELAYRANLLQAKKDSDAGDLAHLWLSLDAAGVQVPVAKERDFERQSAFLLFSAASNFLKLPEAKRQAQAASLDLEDLSVLRAAAKFQSTLKPGKASRLEGIVRGLHQVIADRELKAAEEAARDCLTISVGGALLATLEASFQGGLTPEIARIERIQTRMGSSACVIDWSKKSPKEILESAD